MPGLQALEAAWVDSRQIESARRAITRYIRRGGKVWIRIFPDKVVTAKPAETRMGSGKGAPDHWVAVVRPGRVMFELGGVREEVQRGFIVHRFGQYLGGGMIGVLFYSVLFGLGHYEQGYDASLATAMLGAIWGIVYLRRGSIVAPVISHAGFNLAQIVKILVLR